MPEHRNRGFWLVVGGVGLASVLLVAAILYNAPMKETIGHAEDTLRVAQAAAQRIHDSDGSFGSADAVAVAATGASIVASANPGCSMQLVAQLRAIGSPIEVVHPIELLDRASAGVS